MNIKMIRILFLISALYDFVLGTAFLLSGPQLFATFNVPLPAHWGYIHFCCLLLMIFGMMFLAIAYRPRSNRNLIPFGVLLKAAYVGVTGYYWINGGVPTVFLPFTIIDLAMLFAFVWAYFSLGSSREKTATAT